MTVIDELLVLLDDEQVRTLDECARDLNGRTRQTLSSTLGRLTGRGWVETKQDRKTKVTTYRITEEGQATVTRTLSHIQIADDASWDGKWLAVLFNIPEKQRKYRDILRNRLMAIGFGRVQNSLWITARDVRFELEGLLDVQQLKGAVTVLRPSLGKEDTQEMIDAFEWDWKGLNRQYQQFIAMAERYLDKSKHDSLAARLLVYRYAKTLVCDPKLPREYEPPTYLRAKAYTYYERLRPYCYTK